MLKKFEAYGVKEGVYGYEIITVRGYDSVRAKEIALAKTILDEIFYIEEI